jgi:ADP-heptose:LPS heptosyltransferase
MNELAPAPLQTSQTAVRPKLAVLVSNEMLGDSLLRLHLAFALRETYPSHEIWWISTYATQMAHSLRHLSVGVIDVVVENSGLDKPFRQVLKRLAKLPRFDLVFDTRTRLTSVFAAKRVLRPKAYFTCLPAYLFSTRRPPGRWWRSENTAERAMGLYEAATRRPAPRKTDLRVGAEAEALAELLLPAGPRYIGFAPVGSMATRRWPMNRFIDLAARKSSEGYVPVFLMGPSEVEHIEAVRTAVPGALFPEQAPEAATTKIDRIERLIAICRRLQAVVSNDSSTAHAVALAGVPLVSLHGPTTARRWAAWVEPKRSIQAKSLAELPVETVAAELDALLRQLDSG